MLHLLRYELFEDRNVSYRLRCKNILNKKHISKMHYIFFWRYPKHMLLFELHYMEINLLNFHRIRSKYLFEYYLEQRLLLELRNGLMDLQINCSTVSME